jgi:hypothetical protein
MNVKLTLLAIPAALLALTACNGSGDRAAPPSAPTTSAAAVATPAVVAPSASPTPSAPSLRSTVQAYSDAYLTGDAKHAYSLLSARCQRRLSAQEFGAIVEQAGALYGTALPMKAFHADVSGGMARVTYTYSVTALNQDAEPWVMESGAWHEDDC